MSFRCLMIGWIAINILIDLGKSLPIIDAQFKLDENLIKGCQSKVWLYSELENNNIKYTADSDAILTKGIAALLIRVYSGQKPADILSAETNFIDAIGLKEHLKSYESKRLGFNDKTNKNVRNCATNEISKLRSQEMTDKELEEIGDKIVRVLKTIYDPEIPVDIYELGLIYDVFVSEEYNAKILMTLTSPNCPVAESLPVDIEEKIKSIEEINSCEVEITFDPTWTQEMMSEEAKLELGML